MNISIKLIESDTYEVYAVYECIDGVDADEPMYLEHYRNAKENFERSNDEAMLFEAAATKQLLERVHRTGLPQENIKPEFAADLVPDVTVPNRKKVKYTMVAIPNSGMDDISLAQRTDEDSSGIRAYLWRDTTHKKILIVGMAEKTADSWQRCENCRPIANIAMGAIEEAMTREGLDYPEAFLAQIVPVHNIEIDLNKHS